MRQYGYGYCSVTYGAEWDENTQRAYAVCDHRLDGAPLRHVLRHHFGDNLERVHLVPEVTLRASPKLNVDFAAIRVSEDDTPDDVIAIETQAIDLRGGGVGPAFRAWQDGRLDEWRAYFTAEALSKGRRDTLAYGVNTGNVYKRLGTQVADKGAYFAAMGVPLYVATQDVIYRQFRRRIPFDVAEGTPKAPIVFMSFEYGQAGSTGELTMEPRAVDITEYEQFVTALREGIAGQGILRADFIEKVKRKAGLRPEVE